MCCPPYLGLWRVRSVRVGAGGDVLRATLFAGGDGGDAMCVGTLYAGGIFAFNSG